jgi:type IV pilus assembly protein PilE
VPRRTDAGFTLIDLLVAMAVISILSALALPQLARSRKAANETSAIASLRHFVSSQEVYSIACGRGGFAASFTMLATPPPGATEPFVAPEFTIGATPVKSGYQFTLGPGAGAGAGPADCNGLPTTSAYYATGQPISFPSTGNRSFATSNAHAIWALAGGAAPTQPFGAPAAVIQ